MLRCAWCRQKEYLVSLLRYRVHSLEVNFVWLVFLYWEVSPHLACFVLAHVFYCVNIVASLAILRKTAKVLRF